MIVGSLIIATIFFVVGLGCGILYQFFLPDPTFGGQMLCIGMFACMFAGFSFVGSLMLSLRDKWRLKAWQHRVRDTLLLRKDVSDDAFCIDFHDFDRRLVLNVRESLEAFFSVPGQKIHSTDNLDKDMQFARFEPWIYAVIGDRLLYEWRADPKTYRFPTRKVETLRDLMEEARTLLENET